MGFKDAAVFMDFVDIGGVNYTLGNDYHKFMMTPKNVRIYDEEEDYTLRKSGKPTTINISELTL